METLTALAATDLAALIQARTLSSCEVVEAHITRIEQVDGALNAMVVRLFDEARRAAVEADAQSARGVALGPLHGVPMTVKECFNIAGTPSTLGIPARAALRATTDAPLVTRLRQAGAIVLGKTNVSQLLLYVESDNPLYGRTNNPWNLARSAGGSSGGEGALIAAGGSALGLGTDIGGSIRVPAHVNGIFGLKPTAGRLLVSGSPCPDIFPGNEAIPDSAGLLARTARDLALAYGVLAPSCGEQGDQRAVPAVVRDPAAVMVRGLRVGVYEDDGFFPASAAVRRAVREAAAALEARGATVTVFRPPDVAEAQALFYSLLSAGGGHGWRRLLGKQKPDPRVGDLLKLASVPGPVRPLLRRRLQRQGQQYVADLVPVVRRRSALAYMDLIAERDRYRERFAAAVRQERLAVLLCPPNALPALPHGASRALAHCAVSYTALYNLLGWPAGVAPVTRVRPDEEQGRLGSGDAVTRAAQQVDQGSAGLPVGVQVIGWPWQEEVVLATLLALEEEWRGSVDYPQQSAL
jgi:fatty acid amide hydrolase